MKRAVATALFCVKRFRGVSYGMWEEILIDKSRKQLYYEL